MVFSKQFQQGDIIATLINNSLNTVQYLRIYHFKGIYFVDWSSSVLNNPLFGKEVLLQWSNGLAYSTFSFVNGFTAADIDKLASEAQCQIAFGQVGSSTWDVTKDNSFHNLTGYIESSDVIGLDNPLFAAVLAYCVKLRSVLKANGIGYSGLEGVTL